MICNHRFNACNHAIKYMQYVDTYIYEGIVTVMSASTLNVQDSLILSPLCAPEHRNCSPHCSSYTVLMSQGKQYRACVANMTRGIIDRDLKPCTYGSPYFGSCHACSRQCSHLEVSVMVLFVYTNINCLVGFQ